MIYRTFLSEHRTDKYEGRITVLKRRVFFAEQAIRPTGDAGIGETHEVLLVENGWIVLSAWVNVKDPSPINTTVDLGYGPVPNYWGNGLAIDSIGRSDSMLTSSVTAYMEDVLVATEQFTTEFIVNGASYGDHVSVSSTNDADVADVTLTGFVISPNIVAVTIINTTEGELSLPTLALDLLVNKAPLSGQPVLLTSGDTIDITATTDTKDVDIDSGVTEVCALVARI